MVRVATSRANWVTGIAIPKLPTDEVIRDEDGDPILDDEGNEQPIYQDPVFIGQGASEFPGNEDTDPSGRIYTEYNFNQLHLEYLDAQGVCSITRCGTFSSPKWPFPEETP